MDKSEIDNRANQIEQRSNFQFDLIKTNLFIAGAVFSFALHDPGTFRDALLLIPVISFVLFSLWFHYGISIRLMDPKTAKKVKSIWDLMQIFTFAASMLSNFVLIPIAAMFFYFNTGFDVMLLLYLGIALMVIAVIFFFSWIYLQYFKKWS